MASRADHYSSVEASVLGAGLNHLHQHGLIGLYLVLSDAIVFAGGFDPHLDC